MPHHAAIDCVLRVRDKLEKHLAETHGIAECKKEATRSKSELHRLMQENSRLEAVSVWVSLPMRARLLRVCCFVQELSKVKRESSQALASSHKSAETMQADHEEQRRELEERVHSLEEAVSARDEHHEGFFPFQPQALL